MASSQAFRSLSRWWRSYQVPDCDMSSWPSWWKDALAFRCSCRRQDFLLVCASVFVCGMFIGLAVFYCFGEYFYTRGVSQQRLSDVELAARLFPFDQRFRHGAAELYLNSSDDALAIRVLSQAQIDEPNSSIIAGALMIHMSRVGDMEGAGAQFYRLVHLAPNAEMVKTMLAHRRDP